MKHLSSALIAILVPAAAVAQVPVQLVARVGDVPTGSGGLAITSVNTPYTDSLGQVGFTGQLTGSVGFIYFNNQVVFKNTDSSSPVLTGAETTMGISDTGDFIYSPSADGGDAAYRGSAGVLLRDGDAAPGLPGLFSTFNSRPTMTPTGTAYWIGGTSTTSGGGTTGRAVFAATGGPGTVQSLLKGGDVVQGNTITGPGLNFNYDFSSNNAQHIHHVIFTGPAASDNAIIVGTPGTLGSYTVLMQEGTATGQGGNWQNFRSMNINNAGNTIVIGDDSTTTDDFLAYNGTIVMRQGGVFDGATLGATVDASALTNDGKFLALWDITGGEALYLGDVSNFAAARIILRTGDLLDTNGDTVADYTLTDFSASAGISNILDLSDQGPAYLEVSLTPVGGGAAVNAIIGISIAAVPEPATLSLIAAGAAGCLGWRYYREWRHRT